MKIWKEKDFELRTSIGSFSDTNYTLNVWAKFSTEIFQIDKYINKYKHNSF